MELKTEIRPAIDSDEDCFVDLTLKLCMFNWNSHHSNSKTDNTELMIQSVKRKALDTFNNRNNDTLILIAESESKALGYVLGRIFEENDSVDNGTGRMGLLDELFLDETVRGLGIGQKLINETISWMKQKNINRIKLHAYSWNNLAKRLYERNGFNAYAVSYELFL